MSTPARIFNSIGKQGKKKPQKRPRRQLIQKSTAQLGLAVNQNHGFY
jgi:hypothetical protein